ncbi:PREDICTED: uncharacterized protein LOC105452044 [Wasmannia auropunctata]|uniref:uncharacterized protein LOC105452044 n=1 Tax=Wasmannia auropunctata TaxID=64793 RepID=UPI0005EFD76A|nr:PREDICTED: uncharacterized protein LOC105452044 [Wasmannia auropunctata]
MAGQIQLFLFSAIIACMVHSAPLTVEQSPIIAEDVEIRANLDKTVDALLPSIREFIVKKGMDPMKIADISEYIFPLLPWKLKGNIDLKNGWMQNLSLVKRTEHVTAIYKDKRLTLDMNLGFDLMDFSYQYSLTHLLYKRQGDVYGRMYQLNTNVVVTVDLNEYILILDSIKLTDVGRYDIKFEGHLLDHLLNAVTKVVTVVFKRCILTVIEDYSALVFGEKINEWNTMLPRQNRTEIIDKWLDIVRTGEVN